MQLPIAVNVGCGEIRKTLSSVYLRACARWLTRILSRTPPMLLKQLLRIISLIEWLLINSTSIEFDSLAYVFTPMPCLHLFVALVSTLLHSLLVPYTFSIRSHKITYHSTTSILCFFLSLRLALFLVDVLFIEVD